MCLNLISKKHSTTTLDDIMFTCYLWLCITVQVYHTLISYLVQLNACKVALEQTSMKYLFVCASLSHMTSCLKGSKMLACHLSVPYSLIYSCRKLSVSIHYSSGFGFHLNICHFSIQILKCIVVVVIFSIRTARERGQNFTND